MEATKEEFSTWAKSKDISTRAVDILWDAGCCTSHIVSLLTDEDIGQLQLNLGDRVALRHVIMSLRQPAEPTLSIGMSHLGNVAQQSDMPDNQSSVTSSQTQSLASVDHVTSMLTGLLQPSSTSPPGETRPPTTAPVGAEEPTLNGNMNFPNNCDNFYDVLKYVDNNRFGLCKQEETVVSSLPSGQQLVCKSNTKVKLENLSPNQWAVANLNILKKLLSAGSGQVVFDYLDYVTKTLELGEVYEWHSILKWDQAFREKQKETNCSWTQEFVHLDRIFLRLKYSSKPMVNISNHGNGPHIQLKPRKHFSEPCKLYNVGKCNFNPCRYVHKCSIQNCGGAHPLILHGTATDKAEGQTIYGNMSNAVGYSGVNSHLSCNPNTKNF